MSWYLKVLSQYADFAGRARRKEFWMFVLFNTLIGIALSIIDSAIGTPGASSGTGLLGGIYSLALLIPGLAVSVRRLHDIGRSGWWLLLNLIPIIGWIVVLVWDCTDSETGSNQYGPNPKSGYEAEQKPEYA